MTLLFVITVAEVVCDQGNSHQRPAGSLAGQRWLSEPAVLARRLPGTRSGRSDAGSIAPR